MADHLHTELAGSEIFGALAATDGERLSSLLIPRSFQKDQVIFLKGDPGFGLYLIRSGKVKVCAIDRNGDELIFTFLTEGDVLGEMAILDGKPRSATAIAVDRTDTAYLDRTKFLEFLRASPQTSIGIISTLCQRLRRVSKQLEEMSFLDVSGRIAKHLLAVTKSTAHEAASPDRSGVYAISQEELARVVGASRVMVNRVLNSFVDLRLVSMARKKITVLDAGELARIASYDLEN